MYRSSSDEPHHRPGLTCGKRIRDNATMYGSTDVRLQVTYLVTLVRPRRLGVWVMQILRAAPVEKPATAGALMNSTFYGSVCVSGVFELACSLTIHPSLKRPIPKIRSPTRKPMALAIT